MSKKVLVGMSGGVDSSVVALLLKEQGYDVIGATMVHFDDFTVKEGQKSATDKIIEDAKRVADYIGVPHYCMNMRESFYEKVIKNFISEYTSGRTPNPCVLCNPNIKWAAMMEEGKKLGVDYLATGHYAHVVALDNGRYALSCANNKMKDQTYALYGLKQEQLSKTIMPLGDYVKDQVRDIARIKGIPVAAKPDSMEICFIPDNDHIGYIMRNAGKEITKGNFVDKDGKVIGQHKGIINYTVGQRKGLNLSLGKPVFVTGIKSDTNEIVIGDGDDIMAEALECVNINTQSVEEFTEGMLLNAKIRYNHKGAPAKIEKVEDDRMIVRFLEPVRAVTPGQAVVLYDNNIVAGGGTIVKAVK